MDKVPIKAGSSVEDFLSFQPEPAIHGKPWSLLDECQRSRTLASQSATSGENHQYPDLKLCRFGGPTQHAT